MANQRVFFRCGWRYLKTIGGSRLSCKKGFNCPVNIALGKGGVMAVLGRGLWSRVTVFNYDEEVLGEFGKLSPIQSPKVVLDQGTLVWPTCLAFDSDGLLYVADEHTTRISRFTIEGKLVSQWGTAGDADGELNGPSGMVFDGEGNLFVVDHRNHRIQKFTKDGGFLGNWGGFGDGEGELNLPWGITLDHEGNVFVADWRNDRIQKFTPSGEFLAAYGTSGNGHGEFNRPTSVAVDLDGDIYVADWMNDRVQVIGADGRFVNVFHGDATISKWALEVWATEVSRVKLRFLADDPTTDRLFKKPSSVALDDQGRLYVVDSHRGRVQIYLKEGYPSSHLMEVDLEEELPVLLVQ